MLKPALLIVAVCVVSVSAVVLVARAQEAELPEIDAEYVETVVPEAPKELTEGQWRAFLSPLEFRVLRRSATEYPGTGRYLDDDAAEEGAYHCVGCGNALYPASNKFHSGCGWPSFFEEINEGAITRVEDRSHGMVRVEMRCANCDGHLGHIFEDAPDQPGGKRHCVNGAALLLVPADVELAEAMAAHRARVRAGEVE